MVSPIRMTTLSGRDPTLGLRKVIDMADQEKNNRAYSEEFTVSGDAVVARIKELLHEGNIRRISIMNEEGKTLIEIPLTFGVIGTVLLPVWAAIGAIAALAARLTISVERVDQTGGNAEPEPAGDEAIKRLDPYA